MKASGKKQKGARLERKVAAEFRRKGFEAKRMPMSGAIEGFKTDILGKIPFSVECKNQEKVKLWEWWQQAKQQEKPFKPALLCISSNFRPILAVVELETIINLAKTIEDYEKDQCQRIQE